ncbi:MAG: SprB repeat-containing protein, partial [Chitinophagaceae bacterium]
APPPALAATVRVQDIVCGQTTGNLNINVTGGTAPFTYSLNGGTSVASNIFNGLGEGSYKITVRDAAGCVIDANATIKKSVCISRVFVPTAFTPNNNSQNDFLQPYITVGAS